MVSGAGAARSRRAASHPHVWSVLVDRLRAGGFLLATRFALVFGLPLLIRHAVDRFAALVLAERDAGLVGLLLHPVGQAVAAEAGEIHQVDVLHVDPRAQMVDQTPEDGCFELGAGLVVEGHGCCSTGVPNIGADIRAFQGHRATGLPCQWRHEALGYTTRAHMNARAFLEELFRTAVAAAHPAT